MGVGAFWLAVWQVASMVIGQELLLVSPLAVVGTLAGLVGTMAFWTTVWFSFARIAAGFLLAVVVGVCLAALAGAVPIVDALVTPLVKTIRSVPVFSFIILVLIWTDSSFLGLVISFLMVMPIVFINTVEGIGQRDPALLEMAEVFRVSTGRRVLAVDVPQVAPYTIAGCKVGVGLAWKSGISGEVIGLPAGSIGERLYQAKLFLDTGVLFAWTLAIIAISFAFERVVLRFLRVLEQRLGASEEAR